MMFRVTVSRHGQPSARDLPHHKDPSTWNIKDCFDFLTLMSLLIRPIGTKFTWFLSSAQEGHEQHVFRVAVDDETVQSPALSLDPSVVAEILTDGFQRVRITDCLCI